VPIFAGISACSRDSTANSRLNTIGNFIAKTAFEKTFVVITLIIAYYCGRLTDDIGFKIIFASI
jgi:hypothetical protein